MGCYSPSQKTDRRWIFICCFALSFVTSRKSSLGSSSQTAAFHGVQQQAVPQKSVSIRNLVTPPVDLPQAPPPKYSPTFYQCRQYLIWYILVKRVSVRVFHKRNFTFPLQWTEDQLPCEQPCDFHTVHPGNVSCAADEQSGVHQGCQFPPWPANIEIPDSDKLQHIFYDVLDAKNIQRNLY